ncbi:MAG: hypothetical protein WED00_03755 [Aquisalimonadaceae bacterium]
MRRGLIKTQTTAGLTLCRLAASATLGLLMTAAPAQADIDFGWDVDSWLIGGSGTRDGDDRSSFLGTGVEANAGFGGMHWLVRTRATLDLPLASDHDNARGHLREANFDWRGEHLAFTLGRQRVIWGRTDGNKPTNVLTPRHVDRPVIWESEEYAGVDAAHVGLRLSDAAFLGVYAVPHFRPSRLPRGLWQGMPVKGDSVAVSGSDPGLALRFEWLGNGFDGAITASRTAELTPYLRPTADGLGVERRHGELRMFGWDFALTRGSYVYRGEFAYLEREEDPSGLSPGSTFALALGAERELTPRLTGLLQVLFEDHRRRPTSESPALAGLAAANQALFRQTRNKQAGLSLSATLYPPSYVGSLTVDAAGYEGGETLLRVRGQYPVGQHVKLELLAEHFDGPAGSAFGVLSENNVVWGRVTVSFGSL